MQDSAKYAKIVEWSQEDGCYVGSAPGLLYGGVTGWMKNVSPSCPSPGRAGS
jgi:hypothetical protein